ncbi:MAG: GTPase HflX, partial [Ilumatobacteraceae bacterium]
RRLVGEHEGSVAVSALTGEGTDEFLQALGDRLRAMATVYELLIPYDRGDLLAAVHREGEVLTTHHDDEGVRVRARLAEASAGRLSEFVVAPA